MSFQPGVARQGGVGLVIAALLLVFSGVFAGAAAAGPDKQPDTTLDDHPSGKDRTEEPGNSGTQGKAASDPDDTANRGPDKPEQAGGFDDDKDGNNGCGNDDDFEDDNNGNCRGRVQGTTDDTTTASTTTTQSTTTTTTPVTTDTAVQGVAFDREAEPAKVLGVTLVRDEPAAAPAALAATGAPARELVAGAVVLIASGLALVAGARRRETTLA